MDAISDACRAVFDESTGQGKLFIGFSGGLDSSVMLHALAWNSGDSKERLIAVHVDHGLADASTRWRDHCERVAVESGVAFVSHALALEPGSNMEARARAARYQIFTRVLNEGGLLLLAHHRDDQLESVLLHLFQGRGLFGMPKRRALGQGMLLRPLLERSRAELEHYASHHGLQWIEDASNTDRAMDRNYLRHEILPGLRRRFENLEDRLDQVLRQTRGTEQALLKSLDLDRNPLPLATLERLSQEAATAVLRRWLGRQSRAARVSEGALADFLTQLGAAADRQPVLETPSGSLRRYRDDVYFVASMPRLELEYPLQPPCVLKLPHGELVVASASEDSGAAAASSLVIGVRGSLLVAFTNRLESAARMAVGGLGRRPRELMRESGLPPWERDRHPLLFDDTGLIAIPNVAVRDGSEVGSDRRYRIDWQPFDRRPTDRFREDDAR